MSGYSELAKKLHDKSVQFDMYLRNLKTLNSEVQKRLEKILIAMTELYGDQSLSARIACTICATNPRSHCIIPCGHGGFCEGCAQRGQTRNRCHTCRGVVEGILKIYM